MIGKPIGTKLVEPSSFPGSVFAANPGLTAPGAATVNPPVSVAVPPDVVTRTSRAPVAAVLLIVMLSEMLVVSTETTEPVTPVPLKVTAVAPARFVPVIVAPRIVAP